MNTKFSLMVLLVLCIAGFVSAKPQLIELGNCGENEEFAVCLIGCPPTCGRSISPILCLQPCIAGCQCRSGYVLNNSGRCVRPEDC